MNWWWRLKAWWRCDDIPEIVEDRLTVARHRIEAEQLVARVEAEMKKIRNQK